MDVQTSDGHEHFQWSEDLYLMDLWSIHEYQSLKRPVIATILTYITNWQWCEIWRPQVFYRHENFVILELQEVLGCSVIPGRF